MTRPLKLSARDAEDLCVISACMQDALVSFTDVSFLPVKRRFLLLANRFKWENCPEFLASAAEAPAAAREPCETYERVSCAVCFDDVRAVRMADIDRSEPVDLLELLAITLDEDADGGDRPAQTLVLHFAGGGTIRLEVGAIQARLEDLGHPWRTERRPCHPIDETA